MLVRKKDGSCRCCQGQLRITGVDDATMEVECQSCGETYLVETDAFGDGGMDYFMSFVMHKEVETP